MHASDGCVCVCVYDKSQNTILCTIGTKKKEDYVTFVHHINCAILFHNFPLRTISFFFVSITLNMTSITLRNVFFFFIDKCMMMI
jgi:hypothetical protein